jgi:hypothetical protein
LVIVTLINSWAVGFRPIRHTTQWTANIWTFLFSHTFLLPPNAHLSVICIRCSQRTSVELKQYSLVVAHTIDMKKGRCDIPVVRVRCYRYTIDTKGYRQLYPLGVSTVRERGL